MARPTPPPALPHPRLSRVLDFYSSRITDPVNKLWFIKRTLEGFNAKPAGLRHTPLLRPLFFHYVAIESLAELMWNPRAGSISLPRGPILFLYRVRHLALALAILAVGYASFRVGALGYAQASRGADWVFGQLIPEPVVAAPLPSNLALGDYPDERIVQAPKNVWLVEKDDDEEFWSNGLRIVTTFETPGTARQFLAFPKDGSPPVPMGPRPVGIIYHASESDMAPFAQEFSTDILTTTRELMGWLSRREIYNYVIDRFGQVYRIVSDESVAVHAGHSVWADDDYHYLNLNSSFIGISFESQWSAGGEIITGAQLQSAVNLTDILRLRYDIPDANCVPHGLVSVNPDKMLIGYHADWARDFPFQAFGLQDKYSIPAPSMLIYGFHYDEHLSQTLGGELWEGVHLAEAQVESLAKQAGVTPPVWRARRKKLYAENLSLVRH